MPNSQWFIKAQKANLRVHLKTVLATIPKDILKNSGQQVANHVEPWLKCLGQKRHIVAAYFKSMRHEIDTKPLEEVLIRLDAIRVVPVLEQEKLFFESLPKDGPALKFDPAQLDVIFMPGLGFDKKGHRLGRGKGHFDLALSGLAKRPILIGIALDEQVVDSIPSEPHDIDMDFICTPILGMIATNQRDQ